jgi:hypothetical protein
MTDSFALVNAKAKKQADASIWLLEKEVKEATWEVGLKVGII